MRAAGEDGDLGVWVPFAFWVSSVSTVSGARISSPTHDAIPVSSSRLLLDLHSTPNTPGVSPPDKQRHPQKYSYTIGGYVLMNFFSTLCSPGLLQQISAPAPTQAGQDRLLQALEHRLSQTLAGSALKITIFSFCPVDVSPFHQSRFLVFVRHPD